MKTNDSERIPLKVFIISSHFILLELHGNASNQLMETHGNSWKLGEYSVSGIQHGRAAVRSCWNLLEECTGSL